MDVCKCIVPLRYGGTINIRQAASPLVRLVEGEEGLEASDHIQGVCSLSKLEWNIEVQPVLGFGNFNPFPSGRT
ncbi:hypothetical protein TNCV_2692871 [Trichonephila clavipes]|uniref:Uncharacterized protein n=1 Tax=Trichonephila clavipes TaxID=2585209 RepID=A0A8X7BAI0_TRICX|nr:hypothetical protein TNCV_2692871 [Trichonephila clavipes]